MRTWIADVAASPGKLPKSRTWQVLSNSPLNTSPKEHWPAKRGPVSAGTERSRDVAEIISPARVSSETRHHDSLIRFKKPSWKSTVDMDRPHALNIHQSPSGPRNTQPTSTKRSNPLPYSKHRSMLPKGEASKDSSQTNPPYASVGTQTASPTPRDAPSQSARWKQEDIPEHHHKHLRFTKVDQVIISSPTLPLKVASLRKKFDLPCSMSTISLPAT